MENSYECECPDFCGEFLRGLQLELQNKVVTCLHDVVLRKCEDACTMCEGVLKDVEVHEGIDSFIYGIILREICLSLVKVSESDAALSLVNQRLSKLKNDHFTTFIILGTIYDQKSDYENAFKGYQQANDVANEKHDSLQCAVSLAKMASSKWNLEDPESSRRFTDRGRKCFEQSSIEGNKDASKEHFLMLVDYYKTMGYLCRVRNAGRVSKDYYEKALEVIKNHIHSQVQEIKILSQISVGYARLGDKLSTNLTCVRALHIIECSLQNVPAHAGQIMHIMKRLGFAYELVKNLKSALEVSEKTLGVARNFVGDAHPEVARMAADIAVLCHKINQPLRVAEFLVIFQNSLKAIGYKDDPEKTKMYVRELTDALTHFGLCHLLQSNYAAAIENYEEALNINIQVYGEMNIRTARVMKLLGAAYNKWGKHDLAKPHLEKSLTVVMRYQPKNKNLVKSLHFELMNCNLKKRGFQKKTY